MGSNLRQKVVSIARSLSQYDHALASVATKARASGLAFSSLPAHRGRGPLEKVLDAEMNACTLPGD